MPTFRSSSLFTAILLSTITANAGEPPAFGAIPAQTSPCSLAILHINVVPMDTEQVLPDRTVTVAGGVIRSITSSGKVPGVPTDRRRSQPLSRPRSQRHACSYRIGRACEIVRPRSRADRLPIGNGARYGEWRDRHTRDVRALPTSWRSATATGDYRLPIRGSSWPRQCSREIHLFCPSRLQECC